MFLSLFMEKKSKLLWKIQFRNRIKICFFFHNHKNLFLINYLLHQTEKIFLIRIKQVTDITKSLEKLTSSDVDEKFADLYRKTVPGYEGKNLDSALDTISKKLAKRKIKKSTLHWVVISQKKFTSNYFLKKFSLESLSNLNLLSNGTVILSSLKLDQEPRIKIIEEGIARKCFKLYFIQNHSIQRLSTQYSFCL